MMGAVDLLIPATDDNLSTAAGRKAAPLVQY